MKCQKTMPTESETRKHFIDQHLLAAGWDVGDPAIVLKEFRTGGIVEEPETAYGSGFSDYVLLARDGIPAAVIEAKRTSKDAETGREQARQYCERIRQETGILPFCFYTNGLDIFFWDIGRYPPRKVVGFPTRDDLARYHYLRQHRQPLGSALINTGIAGRDYQVQAIREVCEGIERQRTRFLLVMATGTGKTRTVIALADMLMRAGWAERVLFLVDRIALRNQTLDAFKEHLPDEPRWPNEGETTLARDRRIYVSTYPTMLNIIRDEQHSLSPHFFDLVVVDESHRSIYNTYNEVLRYFHAICLGLTATPTDVIDHNTFQLFDCEDGLPDFAFSYEEALDHDPPYLCPFQVQKIRTRFQKEGISQRTISLADQKKLLFEGKEVAEVNFEASELEKTVTNRGTNASIVKEFMECCIKDPNGVLPGKSIFFCATKAHARRIEELFDALYPEYKGELAKVMVSEDPRVHGKGGLIHQFTHSDMPRVAISVDMLDTGIDVREVVNLVFAKPVFSYTKFWQMIGRGTRLLEPNKLKAWCPEKDTFLILDCWDNFEYFQLTPRGRTLPPQESLPVRFARLRLEKIEQALELDEQPIAAKEAALLRGQVNELPAESITIREAAAVLHRTEEETFWSDLTPELLHFLRQEVIPLFRAQSLTDFAAMRFRKDVLESSIALLCGQREKFDALRDTLVARVAELPLSINTIARHSAYIQRVQQPAFWAAATDSALDELADTLAPLMQLIDPIRPPDETVYLNLHDPIDERETIAFGPGHQSLSIARYRERVEARVAELAARHPVLQKIRAGQHINDTEAQQLAESLQAEDPWITEALLRKIYRHRQARFLEFIRHILGIEPLERFDSRVGRAVEQFIHDHTALSARQIEFLHLLRDFIIERGGIETRHLLEAPFTVIHPKGIRGVFSPGEVEEVLKLAEKFAA